MLVTGYTVAKVTTDAAPGRKLKANSCGFISLTPSDRWPLNSFYFYTSSTDPSASYSLSSLPEQPALLCRNGVLPARTIKVGLVFLKAIAG